MKRLLIIAILTIATTTLSLAQSNNDSKSWYISAGGAMSDTNDGNFGFGANYTVGRYIDSESTLRIDLLADYLFSSERYDVQAVGVMLSTFENVDIFGSDRIYSSAGLGIGIITNELSLRESYLGSRYSDIAIPIKLESGYRLSECASIGVRFTTHLNLNNISNRSLSSIGIVAGFTF